MSMLNSKGRKGLWPPDASSAKAVIKKGPQGVSSGGKNANERTIVLASTQRAMLLRNGKGGSFGTGELMRMSGREKLELIAGMSPVHPILLFPVLSSNLHRG